MADITRTDAAALIRDAYANDFHEKAYKTSQALQAFPTVNMGTKTHTMPVLASKPHAKWVGETAGGDGVKPTSKATWGAKQLVAEEVAVIVPVHENVVDDATEDILAEIAGLGGEAIGFALDAAVAFGTNKPASWTSPDLMAAATAAGQVHQVSATPGEDDLVGSIYQAAGALDDAGLDPTTFLSRGGMRYRLANLRNTDGTPIYLPTLATSPGSGQVDNVAGLSAYWLSGTVLDSASQEVPVWDRSVTEALVVDRNRVRIGVRQDIAVKFLDQATVGGINLAENDMVALRFKARYAYVLADREDATPVAAITPAAAPAG